MHEQFYGCLLSNEDISRVMKFYREKATIPESHTVWGQIFATCQKPLHDVLLGDDPGHVAELISSLYDTKILNGLDVYKEQIDQHWPGDKYRLFVLHRLYEYANSLGVSEIQDIEEHLGVNIFAPRAMGVPGVSYGSQVAEIRTTYHAPVFQTVMDLLPAGGRVLELGAGIGGLAKLCSQVKRIEYHTCDLPLTSAICALVLMQHRGVSVSLNGGQDCAVAIHGPQWPEGEWDLVVNQDGLPEMPESEQGKFISLISRSIMKGGKFLSVNHELATPVSKMVNQWSDLRLVSRKSVLPNRSENYVEEVWEKI